MKGGFSWMELRFGGVVVVVVMVVIVIVMGRMGQWIMGGKGKKGLAKPSAAVAERLSIRLTLL